MYAPATPLWPSTDVDTRPSPADRAPIRVAMAESYRCIVSIHRWTDQGGWRMLEFAILGLLQQSPMHGYELRKELAAVLGGLRSISYGSLYPALKRMQAAGLIPGGQPTPRALPPLHPP